MGQAHYKKGDLESAKLCFDQAKEIIGKDKEWRKWFDYFQIDFSNPDGFLGTAQLIAERFGSSPEVSIETYNQNRTMEGSALPRLI